MKTPSQNNVLLSGSLILSVGEATKILGEDSKGRTDDEIAQDLLKLTELAHKLLNNSILPKRTL